MKPRSSRKFGSTQMDIARKLELSQATVAIALDPKRSHQLPEKTISRVKIVAKELNYYPQQYARILRGGRSHTIGVIFQSSQFHAPSEHVTALAQETLKRKYQLVGIDLNWFQGSVIPAQNHLLGLAVEGIVFCNVTSEAKEMWRDFLRSRSIPHLFINSGLEESMDSVDADIQGAITRLTGHLIARGARRLALLLAWRDADYEGAIGRSLQARIHGFAEAIQRAGGRVEADAFTTARCTLPSFSDGNRAALVGEIIYPVLRKEYRTVYDIGRIAMTEWLREPMPPDAILGGNDDIAIGVLGVCLQNGISIPGQIRIAGFDDAPYSAHVGVPLTTVRQPSLAMAREAIQRLIARIEDPGHPIAPQHSFHPCELVIRESTDAAPTCSSSQKTSHFRDDGVAQPQTTIQP